MNEIAQNPAKAPKLKPKYQKYADAILKNSTSRQAGVDAGYSLKRADAQAWRMSKNEQVIAYIAHHRAEQAERNNVTTEDYVPALRRIRDHNEILRPQVALNACAELAKIDKANDTEGAQDLWTGIEIDYGDGTLRVVTGTGTNE